MGIPPRGHGASPLLQAGARLHLPRAATPAPSRTHLGAIARVCGACTHCSGRTRSQTRAPGPESGSVARTDGVETAGGLGAPPPPHVPGTDDSDSSEPTQSDGAGEGSSGASSCDEGKTAGVDRESEPLLYAVVEKFKTLCLAPPSSVHSTRDSDPESDAPAGAGSGVASLISSSCLWLK